MAPRTKKQFGTTEWGQRLRTRLTSMGGRIERGEALARTGKVFDTVMRGGRVRTRVKGSYAPFYTVGCRWPAASAEQRSRAQHVVSQDALLAAELASGNLPIALLDALEEAGVRLLPERFEELRGECDCPDNQGSGGFSRYGATVKAASDPCKHQAALYFELIGELDKNPQTLLELRGMSVDMLLGEGESSRGSSNPDELPYPLPVIPFATSDVCPSSEPASDAAAPLSKMSFPRMPNSANVILQTLQPKPLFSKEDFLQVLSAFYASLSDKKVQARASKPAEWETHVDLDAVQPVLERASYVVSVSESLSIRTAYVLMESDLWGDRITPDGDGMGGTSKTVDAKVKAEQTVVKEEDEFVDVPAALSLSRPTPAESLGSIPFEPVAIEGVPHAKLSIETFRRLMLLMPGDGTVGSWSYRFFFSLVRGALLMLASSNLVPDVAPHGKASSWTVFFRPFANNKAVAECIARLEHLYPTDGAAVLLRARQKKGDVTSLDARSGVVHALSVFLTDSVLGLNFNKRSETKKSQKISAERCAFFENATYSSVTLSDRSNGLVVKRWLSVFSLLSMESEVLLKLDESEPGNMNAQFSIQLMFRDGQRSMEELRASLSASVKSESGAGESDIKVEAKQRKSLLVDPAKEGWLSPSDYAASGSLQSRDAVKFVVGMKSYFPNVRALLNHGEGMIDRKNFESFILERSSILRALGTRLVLPRGITEVVRPKLVTELSLSGAAHVDEQSSWRKPYLKLAELLTFNYRVMLGDEAVDMSQFEQMVKSGRNLFVFKEKFVELDPESIAGILAAKGKTPPKQSGLELLRNIMSGDASHILSEQVELLIHRIRTVEQSEPPSLSATLRPYQVVGFQWVLSNLKSVGGCALLDDMGLGKTLQSITVIAKLADEGYFDITPAIVVCPTSLLSNWFREFRKFAPSVRIRVSTGAGCFGPLRHTVGSKRKRDTLDVVIMSYGSVRSGIEKLGKQRVPLVVLDESQAVKNHKTATAKACRKLGEAADMRLALTGTVVENRLSELHACFDFILPSYLGKLKWFTDTFTKPIERHREEDALDNLKRITAPFMLRRLKSDPTVVPDLPEKLVCKRHVSLSTEQVALYESVREEVFAQIEDADQGSRHSGIKRQGLILKLLTSLKQICNHPSVYGDQPSQTSPERSAKCLALFELLEPIISSGQKVLIFSQYVRTCRLLEKQIAEKFGVCPLVFEGSLSTLERDRVVRSFDRNPARQIMILSLKAGGVGLNLVAASNVIFFDRWWNPAVEEQATDRAFRIGQKKNVVVTKLICSHTFEERIDRMIEEKREITELTVGQGENWIGKMSNDALRDLFTLSSKADDDEDD